MGNKQSLSAEELAKQYNIKADEVEALITAFKEGNKKGGAVKLKKFKKIMEAVYKLHQNPNFAPEAADIVFSIFDADKNGKVDAEEFIAGVTILSSGDVEQKARLVFKSIDKNKSGKINKAEFRAYCVRHIAIAKELYTARKKEEGLGLTFRLGIKVAMRIGQEGVVDELVEGAFKADKDSDGEIDEEEWVAAAKAGNESIEAFLNPGDAIRDGIENIDEALKEAGLATTKEDTKKLFEDI